MSTEEITNFILQTSKSELIKLQHELSAANMNEFHEAIHLINEIINLME